MWNYYLPTKVMLESGLLKKNSDLLSGFGKKAIIATGRNSAKKSGALDDVLNCLKKTKIEYVIFDKIMENPSFECAEEGTAFAVENNCDFVIAIGGGSPLDAAKAMAVLAVYPEWKSENLFTDKIEKALPLIAIPLTSGTGSEVTPFSILTDRNNNKKGFGSDFIFPKLSILDPEYTLTMSEEVTVSTALDALTHSIEGELKNFSENPVIKMMSLSATKTIKEKLEELVKNPNNVELRKQIQEASMLAGIVITHCGTTIVHSAGYPLSSFLNVKHGLANAIYLIQIFSRVEKQNPQLVKNAIEPFYSLKELEDFFDRLKVYDIELKINKDVIETWAKNVQENQKSKKTPGDFDMIFYKSLYERYSD